MRGLTLSLIAVLGASTAAGEVLAAPSLVVPIDQSAAIALPRGVRDVLIGNPAIADVNVLDASKAVVLGKGYGVTNLIVIDQLGRTVMERQIVVAAPQSGRVSVIRGPRVDDYACASGCERAVGGDGKPAEAPKP